MSAFWPVSEFNYNVGDLVQAKVLALNERGWNVVSDPNTLGALVQVVPD
jgi:hypothetical protein